MRSQDDWKSFDKRKNIGGLLTCTYKAKVAKPQPNFAAKAARFSRISTKSNKFPSKTSGMSALKWINLFEIPTTNKNSMYSVLVVNKDWSLGGLRKLHGLNGIFFDPRMNKHVACHIIFGGKGSQIKIVPTVSTEYPPFESQYVYKYSGRDVDHYALKHIDVLPTGSPVQKDKVIVSGNKTATIFNVMELVETATKHQQEIIMGTHTDESERNKVVTEQHKRMIHENQMKDIYSEGCNYESEMFSNCIKQHQNLKLCEPYRAKLTTCQHLALREVRFQSTYARTSTTKASTTQSARLAKVAEAIREAPVSTSANLDTGAQSMNALLPAPPADVGSERDASVPMGPDESNKAEYIIRHIAELILQRIFGEWQVEGEEKIQEMVPPMMRK